ncbi:histidine phosphatase family protein [Candidatus Kaiserbacteria bacterium]|nr:histidine phosphatase family protein [Candidatus Kaiserbacteria bacterium]
MKTRFLMIRHAQSVAKALDIVQGRGLDVPLSDKGKEQGEKLASVAGELQFDRMFSSTAVRARETARFIRRAHPAVPYEETAVLVERSKGDAEGMTNTAFDAAYPDILEAWSREEDPRPAGGESFADVEARIMPLVREHCEKYAGETILYVGHGNAFRVILGAMLGIPAHMRNRIAQDYCALSIAEYDSERDRWKVLRINQPLI